jgi:hypothetical protein
MLKGVFLMFVLVYLEVLTILEFFKNLSCINKPNIKGFLVWWELVKKGCWPSSLPLGDDKYPLFPWIMTFHKEGQQHSMFELLYNKKHKCGCSIMNFWKLLYKIDLDITLVLDVFTCYYLFHNLIIGRKQHDI